MIASATAAGSAAPSLAQNSGKLREACDQFEALFVTQLVKEMWKAAEAVGAEESTGANGAYRDMFTFEVARNVLSNAGLGIADSLYRGVAGVKAATAPAAGPKEEPSASAAGPDVAAGQSADPA